jgi:undecaprenyl-phosphate 4-deoxy-4-formamido-L-arabinose transferase
MSKLKSAVSVIIPCFKSPDALESTVEQVSKELEDLESVDDYEIILVNDGSPDNLQARLESIAETHNKIKVLELSRNFGQQAAILAGASNSSHSLLLTLDDDGQHRAESIRFLFAALTPDIDVVYGVPEALSHGAFRNWSSIFVKKFVLGMLGVKEASSISAFRLFRREVVEGYLSRENFNAAVIDVVLDWATKRKAFVPVSTRRTPSDSRYSTRTLWQLALNLVTNFSSIPLRFATVLGVLSSCISLALGIHYVLQSVFGQIALPGFASLAVLITFLGSIQLVTLGILGEYVGKLHSRSIGKPAFVIRGTMGPR